MSRLNAEPPVLTTMHAVLETAARMEQELIDGYVALRQRMLDENQPALAAVFERLIAEEETHLRQVGVWAAETVPTDTAGTIAAPDLSPMFDAEGADMVPPETLDAYRAFSAAVRNEERAFVFWSYVAAQAPSADVRQAAEKMAREELGHVATMRRERRQAFHAARVAAPPGDAPDILGGGAFFKTPYRCGRMAGRSDIKGIYRGNAGADQLHPRPHISSQATIVRTTGSGAWSAGYALRHPARLLSRRDELRKIRTGSELLRCRRVTARPLPRLPAQPCFRCLMAFCAR